MTDHLKATRNPIAISYDLKDVISILQEGENKKLYGTRKVRPTFLDTFLYSGRFNSVLGLDGFQIFKDQLKEVIKRVNSDDFGANYINLDKMFEVLLVSGVYYVEAYLPQELEFLKKDERWLTAYRYIANNFPEITYKDFREIVKRFQDADGHSFYISVDDSGSLLSIVKDNALFREAVDAKASLLQLSMKDLKLICEKVDAQPAKSIDETAERIIKKVGGKALEFVPQEVSGRKTLFIKDKELATGHDIIHLDSYLRTIAKVVREDLVEFIGKQRYGVLAS
ncbi:MAG: hypothetical protein ACRENF_05290 [Thermodesulfobacteriota bacterium]